jgi:hypothetical protein
VFAYVSFSWYGRNPKIAAQLLVTEESLAIKAWLAVGASTPLSTISLFVILLP